MTTQPRQAGRPPKDPAKKVDTPARALFTTQVIAAMQEQQADLGIEGPVHGRIASDYVRLAVFNLLKRKGYLTAEMWEDPSWNSLRDKGLV